jgi:hypothetical protein
MPNKGRKIKMLKKIALASCFAISAAFSAIGHAAVLDGQTLGYVYNYPTIGTFYPPDRPAPYPSSVVVGPGIEIPNIVDNIASLDISDTNLRLNFGSNGNFGGGVPFNGFILTDINGTIPDFASITINSATTLAGFDSSRLFIDANTIRVNFVGLPFQTNDILSLDIAAVPEPETVALLGLGLLGMTAVRRKSAKRGA